MSRRDSVEVVVSVVSVVSVVEVASVSVVSVSVVSGDIRVGPHNASEVRVISLPLPREVRGPLKRLAHSDAFRFGRSR